MYRTACVMALVVLCAGLAHSFSWEIVRGVETRLEFVDIYGTIAHTENVTSSYTIHKIIYDPLHKRVLFTDLQTVFIFDITTKKTEYLMRDPGGSVTSIAYDPATELFFWVEDLRKMYSFTLKPESDKYKVNEKLYIVPEQTINFISDIAVDSCGGFVYFQFSDKLIKIQFNGSKKEVVIANGHVIKSFTIDQQAQQIYFTDEEPSLKSADLNGKNIRTILKSSQFGYYITASKDFVYWRSFNVVKNRFIINQIPKNLPLGIDVEPKPFSEGGDWEIAAYCNINDIISQEIQNCDNLKSLLPNNSVSTDVSLLCVHGTKVNGETRCECTQGYSGERCDGSVCHNYCLYGDCSTSADGQPKCSCYTGYSGDRCEVNSCLEYCLNGGLCSLSEEGKPLCRCTGHYEGERCDVPLFQTKCFQAISLLKDILSTEITSVKGVTSTCTSTDF